MAWWNRQRRRPAGRVRSRILATSGGAYRRGLNPSPSVSTNLGAIQVGSDGCETFGKDEGFPDTLRQGAQSQVRVWHIYVFCAEFNMIPRGCSRVADHDAIGFYVPCGSIGGPRDTVPSAVVACEKQARALPGQLTCK